MPVFSLGGGRIAGYCPACRQGTLAITFLDNPARMRFDSAAGFDCCDQGCAADRIYEALA